MHASPELREFIGHYFDELIARQDVADWANAGITGRSPLPGMTTRAWIDFAAPLHELFRQQQVDLGSALSIESLHAYTEGAMGWAMVHGMVRMPDDAVFALQGTWVLAQDPDGWRVLHHHLSFTVHPNEAIPSASARSLRKKAS